MTDSTLPPPLVPAEVDLRDFGFMPLDVRTLLSSSLWIKAKKDPRVAHAAVSLWCECWHQVPAASLPDDDEVLAELARCDDKEWRRIRERALLHFVKCSDGRLYHRHVAEKAMEAWAQRGDFREAKANRETRQQRWRQRLKEMSQELRERGITPPPGASLETLQRLLEASTQPSTSASTSPSTVDGSETGKKGTGTETGKEERENARAEDERVEAVGRIAAAVKRGGLDPTRFSAGDPRALELDRQGATPEEWTAVVAEAMEKGISNPWPWVLKVLPERRAQAAAITLAPAGSRRNGFGPAAPDPLAWRKSDRGIRAMARQVGAGGPREGESYAEFEARVVASWRRAGEPAPQPVTEAA